MRTACNSKFELQIIKLPPGGYTSQYLSDESFLGQALCFVRPIQKDLDMNESNEVSESPHIVFHLSILYHCPLAVTLLILL